MSTNDTLRGLLRKAYDAGYSDGYGIYGATEPMIDRLIESLAALAEPVAGGVSDERAAFEAWLLTIHAAANKNTFAREGDHYAYNPAATLWKAWQARAALNGGAV